MGLFWDTCFWFQLFNACFKWHDMVQLCVCPLSHIVKQQTIFFSVTETGAVLPAPDAGLRQCSWCDEVRQTTAGQILPCCLLRSGGLYFPCILPVVFQLMVMLMMVIILTTMTRRRRIKMITVMMMRSNFSPLILLRKQTFFVVDPGPHKKKIHPLSRNLHNLSIYSSFQSIFSFTIISGLWAATFFPSF